MAFERGNSEDREVILEESYKHALSLLDRFPLANPFRHIVGNVFLGALNQANALKDPSILLSDVAFFNRISGQNLQVVEDEDGYALMEDENILSLNKEEDLLTQFAVINKKMLREMSEQERLAVVAKFAAENGL